MFGRLRQIEGGQGQPDKDIQGQAQDQDALHDHHRGAGQLQRHAVGLEAGGLEGLAPQAGGGSELVQGFPPETQPEEAAYRGFGRRVGQDILPGPGFQPVDHPVRQQEQRPVPPHLPEIMSQGIPPHLVENPDEENRGNQQENEIDEAQRRILLALGRRRSSPGRETAII